MANPSLGDRRTETTCVYATPGGSGSERGRALAEAAIDLRRRRAYREIALDTLPSITSARALYRRLGFTPIEPR